MLSIEGKRLRMRIERRLSHLAEATVTGDASTASDTTVDLHLAIIDLDLKRRPFPSARVFDQDGREIDRVLPAFR